MAEYQGVKLPPEDDDDDRPWRLVLRPKLVNWDEAAIERRTGELFAKALTVWPYPGGAD